MTQSKAKKIQTFINHKIELFQANRIEFHNVIESEKYSSMYTSGGIQLWNSMKSFDLQLYCPAHPSSKLTGH